MNQVVTDAESPIEAKASSSNQVKAPEKNFEPLIIGELRRKFPHVSFHYQATIDGITTLWVSRSDLKECLLFLKNDPSTQFKMLYDLCGIDERFKDHPFLQNAEFTVVYHLFSYPRKEDIRIKVALNDADLNLPSICALWRNANWYEREAWDMFGIHFEGHPNLTRILLPPTWQGHALRKEHPARATELDPFSMTEEKMDTEQEALKFDPEEWGMKRESADTDFMFLNLGPNHPSVHGVFRIALQLDGEEIVDSVPDIGYHHRGAEKMGERQSWHTYIPYTDRVDYLGGVMNNLPYVLSVEKLSGIQVPPRAETIRVMLAEFFRISSHLVFFGTFAQDIGQMSPVFYMFIDREKLMQIIEAICGGRMHPSWFRIGGVCQDLPIGWDKLVREFVEYLPARLDHYEKMVMQNSIIKQRAYGIGHYTTEEAIEWGVTGPGLRATGLKWDLRKEKPYSGYENFDFNIPTADAGDSYARAQVRVDEMRQSLRIIEQCLNHMPEGPYKAEHPITTPPAKEHTMQDIETLIQHFVNVSWGPTVPVGEACVPIEATKGLNSYYLSSDGNTSSYRTRIRTPSFPHLQMIPHISNGLMIADLITIIASIDFVMADVDR